uniref:Uncharacterized protein ycf18 n=1 Tax=Tolypiocladia glomerulata TaxID=860646 RepID=A0A1Z1MUE2_9FLOR|nr:phycobilisome degradation protein [Tolypiocladia glomerulata]ARW69703.1 phycobilisome degradation protein [Tolypiocladia glomerulata]
MNQLNLEQEFKITLYISKIHRLKVNKVKKYLIKTLKKMMIKDNVVKYYIKKSMN